MDPLTLRALCGRPIVVARAEGTWTPSAESAAAVEAIRTELRGLGATLVVRSGDDAWCLRPDGDLERFTDAGDLAAIDEETGSAALVVLDADGTVRFSRTLGPRTRLTSTLVEALRTAARSVGVDRGAPFGMSRRDWLLASLVSSFAAVFFDACASRERSATDAVTDASAGIADVQRARRAS
jgi:hypothetical protein